MFSNALRRSGAAVGILALSACVGNGSVPALPTAQSGDAARAGNTHALLKHAIGMRPHDTTSTSYSLGLNGFETGIAVGQYVINGTSQAALWFTSADPNNPAVAAFVPSASASKRYHVFALPSGDVPKQITSLNGHLYAAINNSQSILDVNPQHLDGNGNPTIALITASGSSNGSIASNGRSTLWFSANGGSGGSGGTNQGIYNYNVSNGASSSNSQGPVCNPAISFYSVTGSNGLVLCPSGNAVDGYDTSSGGDIAWNLPSGNQANAKVVQVSGEAGIWATDLHYGTTSPNMVVYQLDGSGNILNTYGHLSAYLSSGAITARTGIYAVGDGITYLAYCPPSANNPASYSPITIAYPTNPKTPPGGITSADDGSAWMLDTNSDSLVNINRPVYYCPDSASAAVKNSVRRERPTVTKVYIHPIIVRRGGFGLQGRRN